MEPFYIGDDNRQILGIYHAPRGAVKDRGILICPPILGDYMRTHSCLRELAIQLSSNGYHVLRFDYYGTGDSDGDINDSSVSIWQQNTRLAADELRAISGVRKVTAFGARLGATIAATALADDPSANKLFSWDPVFSGQDYIALLNRMHARLIASHDELPAEDVALAQRCNTGYDLSDQLIEDIGRLNLASISPTAFETTMLLTSKIEFENRNSQNDNVDYRHFESDFRWTTFSETVIFARTIVPEIVAGLR